MKIRLNHKDTSIRSCDDFMTKWQDNTPSSYDHADQLARDGVRAMRHAGSAEEVARISEFINEVITRECPAPPNMLMGLLKKVVPFRERAIARFS